MTLSDLEWPFHASRAISAIAQLLVIRQCAYLFKVTANVLTSVIC